MMDTDDYITRCMIPLADTNTYRTEYPMKDISNLLTYTLYLQQTPIPPPPTKQQTFTIYLNSMAYQKHFNSYQLLQFLRALNKFHPSLYFTYTYSQNQKPQNLYQCVRYTQTTQDK